MNEISRIHIAKTPYNIEQPAKKALQKYLQSLSEVINDTETIDDIEVRMTEILAERSIKQDGVIDSKDVDALMEQLGSPADFGIDAEVGLATAGASAGRKLFRNPDGAWLGGVINGIATYTGSSPALLRVVAIVLGIFSRGAALLVYLLAWLIIPRVKNASDKLQLSGKPVTAEAISTVGAIAKGRDGMFLAAIRILFGAVAILLALASIVGGVSLIFGSRWIIDTRFTRFPDANLDLLNVGFKCLMLAALLLACFFAVNAYAAFAKRINRKIVVTAVLLLVFVIGLVTTMGVIGYTQERNYRAYLNQHLVDREIPLPTESFTGIVSNVASSSITYQVTSGQPTARYTYQSLYQSGKQPVFSVMDGRLHIDDPTPDDSMPFQNLVIEGPALTSVQVDRGSFTYQTGEQPTLAASLKNDTSLTINGTKVDSMAVDLGPKAQLTAADVSVDALTIKGDSSNYVMFSTVGSVSLEVPQICGADVLTGFSFEKINDKKITVNGQITPIKNVETNIPCSTVRVNWID